MLRSEQSAVKNKPLVCVLHNQAFDFYCVSCEEPICHLCTTLGPHNFKLHRCNSLQDAFTERVYKIQEEIKNNLLPKRDQLLAQIHRIEYRIEEISYVSSLIERDARAEMGGILERLIHEEGAKQAILQHEAQEIQKDINEMNDLGLEFYGFIKIQDEIGFLLHSDYLLERIEYLIAKPIKQGVDVNPHDLPKELTNLRLQIGHVDSQKITLDLLDDIIWKLLNERKYEEDSLQNQLQGKANEELNEWIKLVDHFNEQLKDQQLVCYFCNQRIDPKIINKKCKQNQSVPLDKISGFTKESPQDQHMGSGRHFWGHSIEQSILKDVLRTENKKIPNFVLIETIVSKIKRRATDRNINLQKILEAHDKDNQGYINHISFSFVLSDLLEITNEEIELLIFFLDDEQKGLILIHETLGYLKSEQKVQQRSDYLAKAYNPKKNKQNSYHFQTPNTT